MANISFEKDIRPVFAQYRGPMLWRFDLTAYEDVKINASLIYDMIVPGGGMPPPPFPPLTSEQVQTFQIWMSQGCPK
jgi:hypothetical protein